MRMLDLSRVDPTREIKIYIRKISLFNREKFLKREKGRENFYCTFLKRENIIYNILLIIIKIFDRII